MCGITGFFSRRSFGEEVIRNMSSRIAHRGPDASGWWSDPEKGIYFAHLRLSILDLSSAGAQPMHSRSGRYVTVFNGEIYNFAELRDSLQRDGGAYPWRGHSDTEIFLAGFEHWGIERTLKNMIGMFAMAVWDTHTECLYLIRDRMGEKPIYYGWQNDTLLFGSELKALIKHPDFRNEINMDALASFFKYNYVPAPLSIYKGIHKLNPGTYVRISVKEDQEQHFTYWSLDEVISAGVDNRRSTAMSTNEYIDHLEELLKDAIAKQMLADVPLGAFLSGGIDSSTVVAIMQSQSSNPVKTFSIGFNEGGFDEAKFARKVAGHLGTDHTELYVSPSDALNVIPKLQEIYDEPFADSSQIPTYLVAKLAKQHVKVSLSGDAGDELFAGYNRYTLSSNVWSKLKMVPRPMKQVMSRLIQETGVSTLNGIFNIVKPVVPRKLRVENFGDKMHKAAALLHCADSEHLYDGMISHWTPSQILTSTSDHKQYLFRQDGSLSFIEQMMRLDALTYLPDDILVKVDRAAMANSLETRVPFLDHRVVEYAWNMPLNLKLRGGKGKWVLRQVLYRHVPKELIERPKMGFAVPINSWLRGPLKDWAAQLLSKSELDQHGMLNYEIVHKKWTEHLSGEKNWQYFLWDVLMFQSWYARYKNKS